MVRSDDRSDCSSRSAQRVFFSLFGPRRFRLCNEISYLRLHKQYIYIYVHLCIIFVDPNHFPRFPRDAMKVCANRGPPPALSILGPTIPQNRSNDRRMGSRSGPTRKEAASRQVPDSEVGPNDAARTHAGAPPRARRARKLPFVNHSKGGN